MVMEKEKDVEMSEERTRTRTIKLYCPSLSRLVQLVAPEEERLDLGYIARAFGLNPSTIKLNGHFISRGSDHIACSVTWKSLFSFFSVRGLSTGTTDSNPLIVDGKLCKVGTKRACDPVANDNVIHYTNEWENKRILHEDTNLLKKMRLDAGYDSEGYRTVKCDEKSVKRKLWLNGVIPQKKARIGESNLGGLHKGESMVSGVVRNMQSPCSLASRNTKRTREEEMVYPCKRSGQQT